MSENKNNNGLKFERVCAICKKEITKIAIYDHDLADIICFECCFRKMGTSLEEVISQFERDLKSKPIMIDFTSRIEQFTNNKGFSIAEDYLRTLSFEDRVALNSCVVNPSICKRLYNEYSYMSDFTSAINIGKIALKLNPFNLNIVLDIASAYRLNKDYDNALFWYQKILEIVPENDEALANMGEIFYEKGEYKQSQKFLERLVALIPNFWRAWDYLSRIYRHYGEQEKTQKAVDIANYQTLPAPMIYKGYVVKKWIDKNNVPKIIIKQSRETVEYRITGYGKKDALDIYHSLEELELIEIFEDGRIYSLGKISRDSWDIKDSILDNLEMDCI